LKEKFTKEPVIAVLDLDKKMRMEVDELDYTMEGVLFMELKMVNGNQWYFSQNL